nr:histidine phosphatase family protein [Pseudoxanthomonas broegbernensis]
MDLLRHASTGRAGHLDGRSDPPLSPGACDAPCAGYAGLDWSRVVASPRRRARDTAQALAAPRGLPVELDEGWAELDFGQWDGRSGSELPAAAVAAFHADPLAHPPPGGEPWDAFARRIEARLRGLLEGDAGDAAPVLVVSHGGPLRMALSQACGWPLAQAWTLRLDYGSRLRLRVEAGGDGRLWGELLELQQP